MSMDIPPNVQKAMRETLEELENAEVAEGKAERQLLDCRNHRRVIQWRLRELQGIEEAVLEHEQAD